MALFSLGRLLATPGALSALEEAGEDAMVYISRHVRGDFGDLCAEDKEINNQAISSGDRILSAYLLKNGTKVWIITEADRSATTVLLPSEY